MTLRTGILVGAVLGVFLVMLLALVYSTGHLRGYTECAAEDLKRGSVLADPPLNR